MLSSMENFVCKLSVLTRWAEKPKSLDSAELFRNSHPFLARDTWQKKPSPKYKSPICLLYLFSDNGIIRSAPLNDCETGCNKSKNQTHKYFFSLYEVIFLQNYWLDLSSDKISLNSIPFDQSLSANENSV